MPVVTTELTHQSAFQLLVATLLSAQCTDKRVNQVTPALFERFPDAVSMAHASEEELLQFISSVSYPNSKARHLRALARVLVEQFNGEVPADGDSLESLPGVGRKTANVLLAVWFKESRIAVDTHVFRVSHRLGLVPASATTPRKVEEALYKYIPQELSANAHHWLLLHGRYVCQSRKARCGECPFGQFCPSKGKV